MLSGPVIIPLGHLPPSQSLSHALEYLTEPICRNASMFAFVSFLKLFFCKKKNFLLNYPIETICRTASSPSHLPIFRHCLLLCFLPPMFPPLLHPLVSWRKKLSKERTLVKRKPPRFSIFLPINLQTLTFRLMKTFPFKGQPANKIVSMFPVRIPNKRVSLQKSPEASLFCWMSRSFHVVRLLYFFSYENSLDPTLPCWINFLSFMNNSFCLCLLPPI